MTLLRPDLAPWALVIPVIIACWALHRHLRVAFGRRSPVAPRFAALSRRTGRGRDGAVLAAGLLTAGALSMALMRPQAPLTRRVPQYRRQDLVIVLDRSASMQARDIVPSRSARATLELRNFIRHKPEGIGRVALIGFADSCTVDGCSGAGSGGAATRGSSWQANAKSNRPSVCFSGITRCQFGASWGSRDARPEP